MSLDSFFIIFLDEAASLLVLPFNLFSGLLQNLHTNSDCKTTFSSLKLQIYYSTLGCESIWNLGHLLRLQIMHLLLTHSPAS